MKVVSTFLNGEKMILVYKELNDSRVKEVKKKKQEIVFLKPKDFKKFKEEKEHEGIMLNVIRNTKFYFDRKQKKDNEYLIVNGYHFLLKDSKDRNAKGYLYVGNNCFVRMQRSIWPLISLLFLLLAAIALIFLLRKSPKDPEKLPMEDNNAIRNDIQQIESTQESVKFIGYSDVVARDGASLLQLKNDPENTSNLVYTILEEDMSLIAKEFNSDNEADQYILKNSKTYSIAKERKGKYYVTDSAGNEASQIVMYHKAATGDTIRVYETFYNIVYGTKGIAPGNAKDWDIMKSLDKGEHTLLFMISVYDNDTSVLYNGTKMTVKVTVQ